MLAKTIVEADAGRHFDPVIVEAFQRRFATIVRMQEQVEDRWPVVQGAHAFAEDELETSGAGK